MRYLRLISLVLALTICQVCQAGIDFDGTDDYVGMGAVSELRLLNDVSVSAWVELDSSSAVSESVVSYIKRGELETENLLYWISIKDYDIDVGHESGAGVNQINTFNTNLSLNKWYHLVITKDYSAKEWKLYVDGVQFGSTYSYTTQATGGTISEFQIGHNFEGIAGTYIDGQITDVAIWDTALSATDIEILYKSKIKGMPLQIKPANLVGYWPLDDLVDGGNLNGVTFKDRSGNGNDGTGDDNGGSGGQGKGEEILSYP